MEIQEAEEVKNSSSAPFPTVVVAINGSKNSKRAVQWALSTFVPEGIVHFRLLYVRRKITGVPTPMGNYIPISKVRGDIASAYMKEVEWQTNSMLLTYRKLFTNKKVEMNNFVIEADDVAVALSSVIAKLKNNKLVVGASSENIFSRRGSHLSSKIARCCPSFCTVYVVSKGKLASIRAATLEPEERNDESSSSIALSFPGGSSTLQSGNAINPFLPQVPSVSTQRDHDPSNSSDNLGSMISLDGICHRMFSFFSAEDTSSSSTSFSELEFGNHSSSRSSIFVEQSIVLNNIANNSMTTLGKIDINSELEKLRTEMKYFQDTVEDIENETIEASNQLKKFNAYCMKEEVKFKECEEVTKELIMQEQKRPEVAERGYEHMVESIRKEALLRLDAEEGATRESSEKHSFKTSLSCDVKLYKNYTWEEIESATSSFSDTLKIGMGANGIVYKCSFHHTVAAVKVLHSNDAHRIEQFKQELDILGSICHPHLLLLLGACPERGCLVYEYMENGSLDDRLQCKDNTAPLPWFCRFKIAWEVASALAFLHNSKPEPVIHRDLKPANILLGYNFVSKIGDVGLSTFLSTADTLISSFYKDTAPVGTFCYIDPEYQRTGRVSPKSDIYALGIVILQLLTGKPPIGLAHIVESALEDGKLWNILDHRAGEWPEKQTQELAHLGLHCAELRRKDRPDLEDEILPLLESLRTIADEAQNSVDHGPPAPPSHFICPILQEVMEDPCVASDGYTYDRKAIETWLSMNDKSPMTNLPLSSINLIPNHSLRSAIMKWKSLAK